MLGANVNLNGRSDGESYPSDNSGYWVPVEAITGNEETALVLRVTRCGGRHGRNER